MIGLLSYYLIFSCLSLPYKLPRKSLELDGISLIICAKNELINLQKQLPLWMKQEGVAFELIVVNDQSTDDSATFLQNFSNAFPDVTIVHIKEGSELKGKRNALLQGLAHAKYDYVALSDADCYPNSTLHLQTMLHAFDESTEIVLGYSPYEKIKGSLLNTLIQYETTLTALMYLSFARLSYPYMGVGRNIAYKKSILTKSAFEKSNLSISGDDDLLVAHLARKSNTKIQINPNSFVYSLAPISFKAWMHQKQRHYSTAKHYTYLKMLFVGAFGALNLLFYINMFTLLLVYDKLFLVLILYLCKLLLFIVSNYRNLSVLKVEKLSFKLIYIDLLFTFVLIFNHLKALKGKHGWS